MRFRKKPVEVEARRFIEGQFRMVAGWCGGSLIVEGNKVWGIEIKTLEGRMKAEPGDWVICGVKGEFYPCKPDIFEATYEPVVKR